MATPDPRRSSGRATGVNDDILDALVRHQIGLFRFADRLSSTFVERLNSSEIALRERILRSIGRIGSDLTTQNRARTDRLIRQLLDIRTEQWNEIGPIWRSELHDLVRSESRFLLATYESASPVVLALAAPALDGIVSRTTWDGRTLNQWIQNARGSDLGAISATVRTAVAQQQTPREATRALSGTARARGRDGALQRTRNGIAALTRTSANAVANIVKRMFGEANPQAFQQEVFVAVLDGRTTDICKSRDGRLFPVGEGDIPPLHTGCRSLRQPLIDGELVGNRTATPLFERRLLREYADQNGISAVRRRADLPRGHKGRFDAFRRERAFQEIGPNEPLQVTWQQWLTRQSNDFQADVLGVTKARLFRDGGLPLSRFVDENLRPYTLADLARRDRSAFTAAGLDPDNPLWESYVRSANPGG